jgi:hypothetical protein
VQDQSGLSARGTLPGPSRRITVEPIQVPVTKPREEPASPLPPPERDPAPAVEPVPTR